MTDLDLPTTSRSLWADDDAQRRAASAPSSSGSGLDGSALPGSADVVIVGAGVVGLSTALLLVEAGLRPIVLERRTVGAGTSGLTTGKVSALQGDRTAQVRARFGAAGAQAHVAGNLAGVAAVRRWCTELGVPYEVRDAWSYATTDEGASTLEDEQRAGLDAGLDVRQERESELPFPVAGAVRLADQLQVDPLRYVQALADAVRAGGGQVIEGAAVGGVRRAEGPGNVDVHLLTGQTIAADWVVLATLLPFPLRSLMFASSRAMRSYLLAADVDDAHAAGRPEGMYLSVDSPTRSLRTAHGPDGPRLLIGGNGHETGRSHPTLPHVHDLAEWAGQHFAVRRITHRWSAQDYQSAELVPQVGHLPPLPAHVLLASGFGKWGFTAAGGAAQVLASTVTGDAAPSWSDAWRPRLLPDPSGALSVARISLQVGTDLTRGWAAAVSATPPATLAEGAGAVYRQTARPVAASMVGGVERRVGAVCPHLGGVVRWNDAEQSWDCPLHGSRFGPDGTALCAPAVHGLAAADGG